MPNYELVEKIRNGSWKNPELSGADLSFANLNRAQLKQADLRNANLERASLINADLTEANLDNAFLKEALLTDAILVNSNLKIANLEHINLSNAKLENADLQGVHAPEANLERARLQNVNLSEADLSRVNLLAADLRKANLKGCNLQDADLKGIDLHDTIVDANTNIDLPSNFEIVDSIILHKPRNSSVNNASDDIESGDETKSAGDNNTQFGEPTIATANELDPTPTLRADPDDRIGVLDGKVPTARVLSAKNNSLKQLETLREELEKFHGNDEEFIAAPNTEEMPLSRDNLEVLKQTVNVSITLHNFPSFPPEIVNALKELMNYLKSIAQYLGGVKIEKVAYLVTALNQSWELIEKFLSKLD